jgi:hypothetical protein
VQFGAREVWVREVRAREVGAREVEVSTVVVGLTFECLGWFSLVCPVISVHIGGVLVIILLPWVCVVWVLWVWLV